MGVTGFTLREWGDHGINSTVSVNKKRGGAVMGWDCGLIRDKRRGGGGNGMGLWMDKG